MRPPVSRTSCARRRRRGGPREGAAAALGGAPAAPPMGPAGGQGPPVLGRRPGRAGFPVRALCGPPDPKLHDIKSISDSISDQARTDLISHDIGSIWTDLIPCKIRSSRNDLISNLISDQPCLIRYCMRFDRRSLIDRTQSGIVRY